MKNKYSVYYKILWRFARTFLSVFLIQVGAGLTKVDNWNTLKSLSLSAGAAGLVSLGKAIREYFKENQLDIYKTIIKRLPI